MVSLIRRLPMLVRQRAESIEEFNAGLLHNEHMVLIEDRLSALDYLPGLLEKLQTRLAASQITAITLMVGVPNVDVQDVLGRVSTRRSVLDTAVNSGAKIASFAAGESTRRSRFALPSYHNIPMAVGEAYNSKAAGKGNYHAAGSNTEYNDKSVSNSNNIDSHDTMNYSQVENQTLANDIHNTRNITTDNSRMTINNYESGKKGTPVSSTLPSNAVKQLREQEGLVEGKQFSVVFERDGNRAEFMLSLSLACNMVPTEMMKTFIAFADQTKTFWDRVIRAKVGMASWGRDIFLQNDIADEYRKNRYRDKTGVYKKMMANKNRNWLSGLLSVNPSINNASSIMIVSADTVDACIPMLGGELDDDDVRARVFKDSLMSFIVVVDEVWGRVKVYNRALNGCQKFEKSEFSRTGKSSGAADVNRIVEAYRAGAQPTL